MRKTLILAISTLLLAAACGGDSPGGGPGVSGSMASVDGATTGTNGAGSGEGDTVVELGPGDVVLTAGLVRFDDCDTLLDYLHTEYSTRVGPWGFDGGGWFGPMPLIEEEMAMASDDMAEAAAQGVATGATAAPVEGVDFSGTNVQEAGVDEADIVKTDGRRIFTVSAGRLVVVDAASRSTVGSVAVAEGWGRELFIDGDSLLLITRSHSESGDGSETVLQRIDVSGDTPEIIGTLNVQGNYISARSVGGIARVIMRYDPQWNFPFVFPQNETAEDVAEAANRAAVLNSTLDDWLPHYTIDTADGSRGSLLVPCGNVHAPSVFSGFGVTTVMNVPIDWWFDPSMSTAVMAPGDTVYASTGSLYTATTRWVDTDRFDDDEWQDAWRRRRTSIHRFDIRGLGDC